MAERVTLLGFLLAGDGVAARVMCSHSAEREDSICGKCSAHSLQRLTPVDGVVRVAEVGLEVDPIRVLIHHHGHCVDDRLGAISQPDAKLHGHEVCVDEGLVVQEQAACEPRHTGGLRSRTCATGSGP
jgi:hypothetical protein